MQRYERNTMSLYVHHASASVVAMVGFLATPGCLQLNDEHCVLLGGDEACRGGTATICTMSLGMEPEISVDGCMDRKPDGFAHVEFGLPRQVGQRGDQGYQTVWGLLAECEPTTDDEESAAIDAYGTLRTKVLDVLDGRSRVRAGLVIEESWIEDFNDAIRKACDDGTTDTSTGTGTETDATSEITSTSDTTETSTTGPVPCMDDEACVGTTTPFCNVELGECVSCDGTPDGDAACAEADPMAPLCVGGECVQCTPDNPVVCEQQLRLCEPVGGTCVPCTEHDQCPSGACDIFVGTCFDPATVVEVGGAGGAATIADGLAELEMLWPDVIGERRGVVVLHEKTGMMTYDGTVTIRNGSLVATDTDAEAIAFIRAPGESPAWIYSNQDPEAPTLTVAGISTRGYLDGITLRTNAGGTDGWGLRCDGGHVDIRHSQIVDNDGGGIQARGQCELYVENSFVGGDTSERDAISIENAKATATILYTTLGAGLGSNNAAALRCSGAPSVDVRNSILVSRDTGRGTEVVCQSATLMTCATEASESLGAMETSWFVNYGNGDLHLSITAPADVRVADWQPGDPLTDIDGDSRPAIGGPLDYAGADVP